MTAPSGVSLDALRDRYAVLSELGHGGMARVYLARDLKHDRLVAIKVLRPELARIQGPERFLREIQLAARLQHPHILGLIDSGAIESQAGISDPYYVMPYVQGESLRQRLERETQLPLADALRIAREVALALDYAHRQGVIHRDIKPENILLSDNQALVADFGVARALEVAGEERLTETGIALGTPAYLSPEQASASRELDGRADIYSLGCVLYEMLAGEPPFTGPTAQAIIAKHFSEPVPHLRTIRDVPEAVEQAVTRALARSPADRFTTAAEFATALGSPAGHAALNAGPPTFGFRSKRTKWIGVGALTGVVALAVGVWHSREARTAASDLNLVAVVPFDVLDPSLQLWREGLVDLLSRSLDGAGALRTVSPATFIRQWRGRADPVSALALGRKSGAGLVVFGTVLRGSRDSVRLRATLLNTAEALTVTEIEVQDDASRIDRVSDSLTVALLRGLGRIRPVGAVRNSPLGASSLPALKSYLQGEQLYRRGMWDSALVSYDRAIELDSGFALAYGRMAHILWWDSETSKDYKPSSEYALRAGELNHGLSPRDSLLIRVDWLMARLDPEQDTAFFQHHRQLSETLAEAARRYPGDPEVWYLSGEYRYHSGLGLAAEHLKLFDRAIQLDSTFGPAYEHALELAIQVGGANLARRYTDKYLTLRSTDALAKEARLAQVMLDPVQARSPETARLLDTIPAVPLWMVTITFIPWPDSAETSVRLGRSLVTGHRNFRGAPAFVVDTIVRRWVLARALVFRGHLREAREVIPLDRVEGLFNPFMDLALIGGIPPDTVAASLKRAPQKGEFLGQGSALPWWATRHDTLALKTYVRRADSAAHAGGSPPAQSFAEYLRDAAASYLALARIDSAAALSGLTALPDSACLANWCFYQKLIQARLYAARKQDRQAAQVLDNWLETGKESPSFTLGTLERGHLAERLQDPERAVKSYQFVVDVWRQADPELQPYVAEARAGLARLTGEAER